MVPAVSNGISPVPPYSGYPPQSKSFQYGTLTPYGLLSHAVLVRFLSISQVLQPRSCRNINGLGSSAFARHYLRNHYYFLLLWVLRCFSSPRSLLFRDSPYRLGCPIRTSTDQFVLADPRGFSQLITSFFASESLGIPRAPLITYFYFSRIPTGFCYNFYFNMSMNLFSTVREMRWKTIFLMWRITDSNR
jgi:hypothetical protein